MHRPFKESAQVNWFQWTPWRIRQILLTIIAFSQEFSSVYDLEIFLHYQKYGLWDCKSQKLKSNWQFKYFFEVKLMTFLLSKSGLFAGKLRKTDLLSTRKKIHYFSLMSKTINNVY